MQEKPGGVCVSWKRKGYTFDYAVHNVFGVTPNSVNNNIWLELGALRGLKAYSFKEFVQVEDPSGKVFTVHTNLDELKKHMEELAPQDTKLIGEYILSIQRLRPILSAFRRNRHQTKDDSLAWGTNEVQYDNPERLR
jgi:phytoene dehydrogenase-like protein